MTCHSFVRLGTHSFKDLADAKTLRDLRKAYSNVRLVFIDEINMVGGNMLYKIHKRMAQIFDNVNLAFGGCDIIGLGDIYQAGAVFDTSIYGMMGYKEKPDNNEKKLYINPYEKIMGNELWPKFKFYELTEIMRQKNDLYFAECLQMIGVYGPAGLNQQQIEFMDKRIFENENDIPNDALRILYTHVDVNNYNKSVIYNDDEDSTMIKLYTPTMLLMHLYSKIRI